MRSDTLRRGAGIVITAAVLGALFQAPADAASGTVRTAAAPDSCKAANIRTGPYQRQMERHLKRPVDGRQSVADCKAIRRFQIRHRLRPADGTANLATYRTSVAFQARKNPNRARRCPVRSYRVTCIDMNRQILWVQKGKRVLVRPVPIRTGRAAQKTRRGMHRIYWRHRHHKSSLYDNAPMPYAQFFDRGQALHGDPGDIFDGSGSAGCVNLQMRDARTLWLLLRKGDHVYAWGRKPGTAR